MRVLIIHNQLWAHYKSKLFSELYDALKKASTTNDLQVCHIAEYESMRGGMLDQQQVHYKYPYKVLFSGSLDTIGLKQRFNALKKAFDSYQPDVLNITGYYDYAQVLLMLYAKWVWRIPVVMSLESSADDNQRSSVKEAIKSFLIRQVNAFFCFGSSTVAYAQALGAQPHQIAVDKAAVVDDVLIRQKFLAARQEATNTPKRFIYVGRLAKEKNLDTLLKAFSQLQKELVSARDWELLLVGTGPEKEALQALAHQLDSTGIRFAGGVPWYEVPSYLAQAHVAILPSYSEPWGLVVNEAMICELPVIVSEKCGCAKDLVQNGQNGFTFHPDQQEELQKHMRYFVSHPDRTPEMGKSSAQIVEQFSAQKVANQMVDCYQKLCRNA